MSIPLLLGDQRLLGWVLLGRKSTMRSSGRIALGDNVLVRWVSWESLLVVHGPMLLLLHHDRLLGGISGERLLVVCGCILLLLGDDRLLGCVFGSSHESTVRRLLLGNEGLMPSTWVGANVDMRLRIFLWLLGRLRLRCCCRIGIWHFVFKELVGDLFKEPAHGIGIQIISQPLPPPHPASPFHLISQIYASVSIQFGADEEISPWGIPRFADAW
jgi:hypothetical protein